MIRVIMILAVIGSVLGGCSYFNRQFGLDDENIIEESIEDVIERQTGIDIDLTPDSEE